MHAAEVFQRKMREEGTGVYVGWGVRLEWVKDVMREWKWEWERVAMVVLNLLERQ